MTWAIVASRRLEKIQYVRVRMPDQLDELRIARSAGIPKKPLESYKNKGTADSGRAADLPDVPTRVLRYTENCESTVPQAYET